MDYRKWCHHDNPLVAVRPELLQLVIVNFEILLFQYLMQMHYMLKMSIIHYSSVGRPFRHYNDETTTTEVPAVSDLGENYEFGI